MGSEQEFADIVSPWALNATELDWLRARVAEAEAATTAPHFDELPWAERVRREQELKALQHELERAEFEARLEAQRSELTRHSRTEAHNAQPRDEGQFMAPVPYWLVGNTDEAPVLRPGDSADAAIERFGYGRAMMTICEGIRRGTLVPGRD